MTARRPQYDEAEWPPDVTSPVYVRVSPLGEIDDLVAFGEAIERVIGVCSQDLLEFDEGAATYVVESRNPRALTAALEHPGHFFVERLGVTPAGELDVQLGTAPLPAPAPPMRVRDQRAGRRWWLVGGALATMAGMAVLVYALAGPDGERPASTNTRSLTGVQPQVASASVSATRPRVQRAPIVTTPVTDSIETSSGTPAPAAAAVNATTSAEAVATPAPATPVPASPSAISVLAVTPPTASPVAAATAATDVVQLLQQQSLPIGTQSADPTDADPDGLLGQAGQYTSAARFEDQRLTPAGKPFDVSNGGAIEVFATADDAQRRQAYLQRIGDAIPDAREYDFRQDRVLLRISGRLSPDQAAAYAAVLSAAGQTMG